MSDNDTRQREDSAYPQVVRAVTETPWAILPSKLAAIKEMLAHRAAGERFTDEEIQARIGGGPARRGAVMAGSVAVLPLYGVIVPRADMFTDMSGGTSVQRFQATLRDALDDESVTAILIDVDSPGGQVDLVPELAAEIRGARGKKPIVAIANTLAASAAYWLAAQADEFVVTPSGEVGSIGVFAAHDDISALQEKLGVKTTLVSAGKFKTENNPFEPLTEEGLAAIQERVDESYRMFVTDIAKGRRVSVDTVRKGFGEGRVVTAKKALAEGMVDRIDTFDATVSRLQRGRAAAPVPNMDPPPDDTGMTDNEAAESGLSFAQESDAVRAAAADAQQRAFALANRTRSLAEFERGSLTGAKRDQLTADRDALEAAAEALDELLTATDPDRHRTAALAEVARHEALRAIARGGAR